MGTIRKPRERAEARRLRAEGMPYKQIATKLGVSPASVFNWTADVELTPEQIHYNLYGPRGPQSPEHIAKRTAAWRRTARERRVAYQSEGRAQARHGDPLHMAGCMLYWAEGSKNRNALTFANSDLQMIRFFVRFLKESLEIPANELRVRLNVYTSNGLSIEEIERHWLDALDLPQSCLRGHTLNHRPTSSSGEKHNRLPYGVCTIKVARSTRYVQHVFGAIQEYGGFDEPGWLDCLPGRKGESRSDEQ
jgi:hypothetical protein